MAEEESFENLECSKCGNVVDQVLALQCNHNLCLNCAAQSLQQGPNADNNSQISNNKSSILLNTVKCEICGVLTILDNNSTEILNEIKQDLEASFPGNASNNNISQQQQSQIDNMQQLQNDYIPSQQESLQEQQESQQQQQQQQQLQERQYLQEQQQQKIHIEQQQQQEEKSPQLYQQQKENIQDELQYIKQLEQQQQELQNQQQQLQQQLSMSQLSHQQQSMNQSQVNRSQQQKKYQPNKSSIRPMGSNSNLGESSLFQDVGNLRNKYEQLQDTVEDLRFKVKIRSDVLLNNEQKLTQKKRELVELVSQAKNHIKISFQQVFQVLEEKQQQLLMGAEEIMEEKFMEIDRCLDSVKEQNQVLQEFDRNLNDLYVQDQGLQADNLPSVLQNLDKIDNNIYQSIKDKINCEFVFDPNSVFQHIESVKNLKMEVIALRGVESISPSALEEQYYEKLKQEKIQRTKDNFMDKSSNKQQQQENEQENILSQLKSNKKQRQEQQENQQYEEILLRQSNQKPPRPQQSQLLQSMSSNAQDEKRVQFMEQQQNSFRKNQKNNVNNSGSKLNRSRLDKSGNNLSGSKIQSQLIEYSEMNKGVKNQLEELKQQVQSEVLYKENAQTSTMERINQLRSKFQPPK